MSIRSVFSITIFANTAGQTVKTYVLGKTAGGGFTAQENAINAAVTAYADPAAYIVTQSYIADAGLLSDNLNTITDVDSETGGRDASYFYAVSTRRPNGTSNDGTVIAKAFADVSLSTYSGATTYAKGDRVNYSGDSYESLQNTNLSHTPSVSPTWWMKKNIPASTIAARAGVTAVAPLWDSVTAFAVGNWVIDTIDGQCYMSIVAANVNHQPSTSPTQWQLTEMPTTRLNLLGGQAMS
jgi:hypothetical protein